MNDKDLLELAAKAAGIRCDLSEPSIITGARHQCFFDADGYQFGWNPLTDDGDALRLAVKLGLWVGQHDNGVTVSDSYARFKGTMEEDHANDPYAATRRAIVRAAAAMGKETYESDR